MIRLFPHHFCESNFLFDYLFSNYYWIRLQVVFTYFACRWCAEILHLSNRVDSYRYNIRKFRERWYVSRSSELLKFKPEIEDVSRTQYKCSDDDHQCAQFSAFLKQIIFYLEDEAVRLIRGVLYPLKMRWYGKSASFISFQRGYKVRRWG